jgi:hypothetical protein
MFTRPTSGHATLGLDNNREEMSVPQIIVKADRSSDRGEDAVMLRERVNVADFESDHFAAQLVERLGWAVSDAHELEQQGPAPDPVAVEAPRAAELSAQPAS